jgi:cysteine synthase
MKFYPEINPFAKMSEDMRWALTMLGAEYILEPDAELSQEDVVAFIKSSPYAHVADQFKADFLLPKN